MTSGWLARAARLGVIPGVAVALLGLPGTALASVTWTLQQAPDSVGATNPHFNSVSCSAPTACAAVGNDDVGPIADIWDGTSWTATAVPDPSDGPMAVSCTAASACTAVGIWSPTPENAGPLALRWDGTNWTAQTVPPLAGTRPEGYLTGVSCISATHCVAVGNDDYSEVWSNGRWNAFPVSAVLDAVSCTTGTFCVAVGNDDNFAEFWNGSAWTSMTLPTPAGQNIGGMYSVSCGTKISCTAIGFYTVGGNGVRIPLVDHFDGTSWTLQSFSRLRSSSALRSVSCAHNGTHCTAVGITYLRTGQPQPLVEIWNGSVWRQDHSIIIPPSPRGSVLSAVSCRTQDTCVAAGSAGSGAMGLFAEHES